MAQLNKSSILFDEIAHTYTLGDKLLCGVTSILSRQLFADKYAGVDPEVLQKAAAYGSHIHEQIELHDSLGVTSDNPILRYYDDVKREYGIATLENEYLVSDNDYVASSIDIVFDDFSLCDVKTTSKLDKEYLSWQLSIYAYLFELQNPGLKVPKLYALWLPKPHYGNPSFVEIPRKPVDMVRALIAADKAGEQYSPLPKQTDSNTLDLHRDAIAEIVNLENTIKELIEKRNTIKAGLLHLMQDKNISSFKCDDLQLIYKKASIRSTIDVNRLKTEYPQAYNACLSTSPTSESLIIKIL